MKIQTLSLVVGTSACNAHCPYCVSKMTHKVGGTPDFNYRNLNKACQYAFQNNVSTVLLTGKGEPTLYEDQITTFLASLDNDFPFVELQTNGILIGQNHSYWRKVLSDWYQRGLTTIAISIAHYEDKENKRIYQPEGDYFNLQRLINYLHDLRYSVRLSCVLFEGGIDNLEKLKELIQFAKAFRVEQLTITPVTAPENAENEKVSQWVTQHLLKKETLSAFRYFLSNKGTELMRLVHGAVVYDVQGQNVCLSNCLTIDPSGEEVRQLIYFPDGHLRYDWQYEGAILF